mmetsp:Transcript_13429/g.42818  ORF Transcript_13429/g.42818 Transcript_13429/m.42818 type:complete len:86 (+) Transcript_13429:810-1067(+)
MPVSFKLTPTVITVRMQARQTALWQNKLYGDLNSAVQAPDDNDLAAVNNNHVHRGRALWLKLAAGSQVLVSSMHAIIKELVRGTV